MKQGKKKKLELVQKNLFLIIPAQKNQVAAVANPKDEFLGSEPAPPFQNRIFRIRK